MGSLTITLVIAALLGLIPANIAKNKGRSFGLWWFYGWMLFIVALPHAFLMPDLDRTSQNYVPQVSFDNDLNSTTNKDRTLNSIAQESGPDAIEYIIKCKELLDTGVITQDEFDAKKSELLGL